MAESSQGGTPLSQHAREEFGRQVRAARERKGMSQTALARRLDMSQQYVSKVELGGVNLTLEEMVRFAGALNSEVEIFVRSILPN